MTAKPRPKSSAKSKSKSKSKSAKSKQTAAESKKDKAAAETSVEEVSKDAETGKEKVNRYFRAIDAALDGLDVYLNDEIDSPFYNHQLTGRILTGYIERLRHSFDAWEDRVEYADRFRIEQAESGYPVFQNVMDLDRDARTAEKQLASIPEPDALRQEMVDYILLKHEYPAPVKKAMARRLYLEEVNKGDVFQPFILPETVKLSINPKSGRPYYIVHWGAYDGTSSLPLIYIAVIEDSSSSMKKLVMDGDKLKEDLDIPFPIDGLLNPDLAHKFDDFCEKNSAYGLTLATIADNMDKDFDDLHPTQIQRIVMGPFYSAGVTSHGQVVESILESVSRQENAWMLTWTQQELFSIAETTDKRGFWSSDPARQTYHLETDDLEAVRQGVSAYERHALVPHEAYQQIYASGKRDEVFSGYKTHVVSGDQVLRDF